MQRFIVRYYSIKRRDEAGCCLKPFSPKCRDCKNWCLHVSTVEAASAEDAVAQQKRFASECDGFTAESTIDKAPPKENAKFKDQRWPMLRKDD